jgi:hypothetical protein
MDDPGRQEASSVGGDERLWVALLFIAEMGSCARIDQWDGQQKALALREAEAELREWWKGQQP